MADITTVSIQPAVNFSIAGIPLSNSVLASYCVTLLLLVFTLLLRRKATLIPGKLQLMIEMLTEFFLNMLKTAYQDEKRARKVFPFVMTLFLFLLIANQFSVLPLLSSVIFDGEPVFRTPTSDWNMTAALALLVVLSSHVIALSIAPLKHLGGYFRFGAFLKIRKITDIPNAFLEFFLGVLDIIGEISKVISLSARLFGNIFAGEVIVLVIAGISLFTSYVVPVPFIFLGIFSSLVQAFVFTFLTIFFMSGTIMAVMPVSSKNNT